MFDCILPDTGFLGRFVGCAPEHPCGRVIAGVFVHLCRQELQIGMRVRDFRPAQEYFRSFFVILEFGVIDEAEVVIKPPVVRILTDAVLHQFDGAGGFTGSIRRVGREKAGSKLISDHQVRVQSCRDLQQRRKFVVGGCVLVMAMSEILHHARPVDASHESVETKAGSLYGFRRTDVERILGALRRSDLIDSVQREHRSGHRNRQARRGEKRGAFAGRHRDKLRSGIGAIISGFCARKSELPR